MDLAQIEGLRPELAAFVSEFDEFVPHPALRSHLRTYVEGQLGPLERKSIEPMADAAGIPPRTLQEFLSLFHWDEAGVRDRIQSIVARDHGQSAQFGTIGIVDETSFAKKGSMTACVQRQYCGSTGKIDNCVVSVHLGYACDDFHTLIDGTPYFPESWQNDRKRCRKAGIPDDVLYRPLHRIAIEQIRHALEHGIHFDWIGADERYGRYPEFLDALEDLGLRYVLEVQPATYGWTREPPVLQEPIPHRRGPHGTFPRLAPGAAKPEAARDLFRHDTAFRKQPWTPFHIKDTHKGPEVWKAKAVPFYHHRHDRPVGPLWLIVAKNVLDGETKFFLSNAPAGTPLEVLLHVAFARWHVERCFEDEKGDIGLDHFEVRRYGSMVRHLIVSMVSHLFLARTRLRLRGEKSRDHDRPTPDRDLQAA